MKYLDLTGLQKLWTKIKTHVQTSLEGYAKKTDLSTVATSGSYNDLTDKPEGGSAEIGDTIEVKEITLSDTSNNDDGSIKIEDDRVSIRGANSIHLMGGHGGDIILYEPDETIYIDGGRAVKINSICSDNTKIYVEDDGQDTGLVEIRGRKNISMRSDGALHIGIGDSYGSAINFYDDDSGIEIDTNNLALGKVSQIYASTSKGSNYVGSGEPGQVLTSNGDGDLYWGDVSGGGSPMIDITYAELKALRDGGNLIPGMFYRITDYVCTTAQADTRATDHRFDIIVQALNVDTLSEIAKADHSGDDYFRENGANLSAWEIKYCLDNDTTRFAWADEGNGKGVIYYMKDEHGNECPYDFKNIQFKRLLDEEGNLDLENGTDTWCYTFGGAQCDRSLPQEEGTKVYNNNSIADYYFGCEERFILPDNVFLATSSCMTKWNKLGNNCTSNTFGDNCQGNILGNNCKDITFGNCCSSSILNEGCFSITFGENCGTNTFGNSCGNNTFGGYCSANIFGEACIDNTFGEACGNNTFGATSTNNTFGNSCSMNTFGMSGNYNTFGDESCHNYFAMSCTHTQVNGSNNFYACKIDNENLAHNDSFVNEI